MTIRGVRTAAKASGTTDVVIDGCGHNYDNVGFDWFGRIRDACHLVTSWLYFRLRFRSMHVISSRDHLSWDITLDYLLLHTILRRGRPLGQ